MTRAADWYTLFGERHWAIMNGKYILGVVENVVGIKCFTVYIILGVLARECVLPSLEFTLACVHLGYHFIYGVFFSGG